MEKVTEYCPVDTILSNIQEAEVPLGAASWTSGKFQGRTGSGNDFEKTVFKRRKMFQGKLRFYAFFYDNTLKVRQLSL